jgi:triacylglycerol lipase
MSRQACDQTVILLHGFAAHSMVMQPLKYRLSRLGFRCVIWSYPTLVQSIVTHADALRRYLDSFDQRGVSYSIVAHSMGAIVTRVAIATAPNIGLQRLVFLAPPNAGLPLGRWAPRFVKRISQPLDELSDVRSSFVNSLSDVASYDVGVIAAKYDVLIPMASTHVSGERAHIAIAGTHNSLLFSRRAAKLVAQFLRNGRFESTNAA